MSQEREDRYAEKELYSDEAQTAAAPLDKFDLGEKDTGPKQQKLNYYPQENFGLQKRAFQPNWFQTSTHFKNMKELNHTRIILSPGKVTGLVQYKEM